MWKLLVLTSLLIVNIETATILAVFPMPSVSHKIVFSAIIEELVKRGHEVVVVTPDPSYRGKKPPTNLTEIDVHDVSYDWKSKFFRQHVGRKEDLANQVKYGIGRFAELFEKQYTTDGFQKLIQSDKKFDLLILEAFVRPVLALTHIFKVPTVLISSMGAIYGNYHMLGAAEHPILYPTTMRQKLYNLTIWEKIQEIYFQYTVAQMYFAFEEGEDRVLKKMFGSDFPNLHELKNNVDMLILNIHPIWEGIRPVPQNVIHIGGVPLKPEEDLPTELQSLLDASPQGVIYVSFGTNVKTSHIPREKIQIMVNVFSSLPYNIFWKWDEGPLPGRTKNIKIFKFCPQADVLRHPNVKLFVTQGGLHSTDDAIAAGVPLIGIPMIGDQWFNTEKYVHYKIGVQLDMTTFNEDIFRKAIESIIRDPSYRENVIKLRSIMHDQPEPPLQRAIWWIEHLLRHKGSKHLRSPAANISWTEYLEAQLVLILLIAVIIALSLLVAVLDILFKLCNRFYRYFKIKKD